jgi:phospholipid/cholesterol/gamma-HCH transport system substrate-binding protein
MSPRKPYQPDERVFGRKYRGRPWLIGLGFVVLLAIGLVLAYTKHIPFTSYGYELKAVFRNAPVVAKNSPVRIAGVNVGKVISSERKGNANEITFTVADSGRPVRDDAQVTIRPRLFLEGNFFLDLQPGSPGAPELPSGGTIPIPDTATAVQLDQVLSALREPARNDLRQVLKVYGRALTKTPTAAENATQAPQVQGVSAAAALNNSFHYGASAGKNTAIVSEALLGLREHDLSNLIGAQSKVFGTLVSREGDLKNLITNFNTTMAALAAQSNNLAATIHELAPTLDQARPTFRDLNASFPALRAFAIDLTPGVKQLPATIRAGLPWLKQAQALLRPSELGNLAQLARDSAPATAHAVKATSSFLPQLELTSRCASNVLVPAGNTVLNDSRFGTGQPNSHEFFFGLANVAGAGGQFDGNGSYIRVNAGGGGTLVTAPNPGGGGAIGGKEVFANNVSAPLGVQPAFQKGGIPPFRFDYPCYRNALPDLNGPAASVAPPDLTVVP